jgi:hypothetical protein
MAGLFSFYLPKARAALKSEPLVYCQSSDVPANQFYFWPGYRGARAGQNAIFVSELDPYRLEGNWLWKWLSRQPIQYANVPAPRTPSSPVFTEFESVTDLGVQEIKLGNRVFRRVRLWECRNLR